MKTNLGKYLSSERTDAYVSLNPYENSEYSLDELLDLIVEYMPTTIFYKLTPKSNSGELILNAAMWRDVIWEFKISLRKAKALEEICCLPFHGSRKDNGHKTIVSVEYSDDSYSSVIAIESNNSGQQVHTNYPSLSDAATQLFSLGYRLENLDEYNKLDEQYSNVHLQGITNYSFIGDSRPPTECNIETIWRTLYSELRMEKRLNEMPTTEQRKDFIHFVQSKLFKFGISDITHIYLQSRQWRYIYNNFLQTK